MGKEVDWDYYSLSELKNLSDNIRITGKATPTTELLDTIFDKSTLVSLGQTHGSTITKDLIADILKKYQPQIYFPEGIDTNNQELLDANRENWVGPKGELSEAIMKFRGNIIAPDYGTNDGSYELMETYFSLVKTAKDYGKLATKQDLVYNRKKEDTEEKCKALVDNIMQGKGLKYKITDSTITICAPHSNEDDKIKTLIKVRDDLLKEADRLRPVALNLLNERAGEGSKSNEVASDTVADTYKKFVKENGIIPKSLINFGSEHYMTGNDLDDMSGRKLKEAGITAAISTIIIVPTNDINYIGKGYKCADDINKSGDEYAVFVSASDVKGNGDFKEQKIEYIAPQLLPQNKADGKSK